MLDSNVDVEELAERMRNFTGAEIEGLVKSAVGTAMTKLVQVCNTLCLSEKSHAPYLLVHKL